MLTPNYLSKKGGRWRKVRLLDLAILLYHVYRGAEEESVGFEDAQRTLGELTGWLNKRVPVPPAVLESALWSCNLLAERGQWWHPKNKPFQDFAEDVLRPDKFNRSYNWIETKEKE